MNIHNKKIDYAKIPIVNEEQAEAILKIINGDKYFEIPSTSISYNPNKKSIHEIIKESSINKSSSPVSIADEVNQLTVLDTLISQQSSEMIANIINAFHRINSNRE